MKQIIISDASCLIALDNIDRMDLLKQVFNIVYITEEVAFEYGEVIPSWINVVKTSNHTMFQTLKTSLDIGEASSIAFALEKENTLLIIDEKKGRKKAKELGLSIVGTLKFLLIAKEKHKVEAIKPLIIALNKNGFRFSNQIIVSLLKEANEL